jgi:hypothetical protein
MEHVPTLRSITSPPELVQTAGMLEVKLTGRPEVACAEIGNGETPKI